MKKKQQILIVDDEEVNRTILNGLFQDEYEIMDLAYWVICGIMTCWNGYRSY